MSNEFYFLREDKFTGEYVGKDCNGNPLRGEKLIGEKIMVSYSPGCGELERAVLNDFIRKKSPQMGANSVFIDSHAGRISKRKCLAWYQAFEAVKIKRK